MYLQHTGQAWFFNCDVRDGYKGTKVFDTTYADGENNIQSNPGFVCGDYYTYDNITEALLKGSSTSNWMTSDDGCMIQSIYCIDGGNDDYVDGTIYTVETDITGADRINDPTDHVDIGAYEYYPNP